MPLDLFYTMVQKKSKNDQKLKSRGGPALSRLRLSGWADTVNFARLRWVEEPKPKITGSGHAFTDQSSAL